MSKIAKKIKVYVGIDEEEPTIQEEIQGLCPSLSYKNRVIGFCVCFGIGWLISFLSVLSIYTGELPRFAVLYTLGNLCALMSSGFLWGPCKQLKSMFKLTRLSATIIYLIFMGLTFYLAFKHKDQIGIILLCVFCQFLAMIWYCLSYIPYARNVAKKCIASCVDC